MSQFYGRIKGSRGMATRQGTAKSGLWCHVSGWNMGIEVHLRVNGEGKDEARVYLTGGSNGSTDDKMVGIVEEGKPFRHILLPGEVK